MSPRRVVATPAPEPSLARSASETPDPHENAPSAPLAVFERFGPAAIFAIITLFLAFDLADDIAKKKGPAHLGGMAVGIVLSLGGLVLMLRLLGASRARTQDLVAVLDRTRADSLRWRAQASQILRGLGAIIDEQFGSWGLSPSEREVALLLLKGLSLKDIAAARNASEPTVRQQAQAIYRKAGLTGRADLAAFFLEDLLLPQGDAIDASAPQRPENARRE